MKLCFYILDADSSNPKGLYVKECEAEEKPRHTRLLIEFFQTTLARQRKMMLGE